MDDKVLGDEHLDPPLRLFERLRQLPGYIWDDSKGAFHSSYDNWQIAGQKIGTTSLSNGTTTSKPDGDQSHTDARNRSRSQQRRSASLTGSESSTSRSQDSPAHPAPEINIKVVARISVHALREERAYQICKNLISKADPEGKHIIRPVDIIRLPNVQGDKGPIIVCIFEACSPGKYGNYMSRVVDHGPAFYMGRKTEGKHEIIQEDFFPKEMVPLQTFLDFAVGAAECLEILHHSQRIVHGEIRGDAFHYNELTGQVKLVNFGSGLRTFEHGLTSSGWSTLSKEIGAKTKLSYMSPEQTGRMPAEPDSRTDIYSLGILFWIMLTQQSPFEGATPMDIIQGVLGRRLPSVSSVRIDVPNVIGLIIQKMTAKVISERYHSATGLRHDLMEVRRLLGAGDTVSLKRFAIASKDVSSFFILPTVMIGRSDAHDEIVKVIERVSRRHVVGQKQDVYSISSGSSFSDPRLETELAGSLYSEGENTSSAEGRTNSIALSNSNNGGSGLPGLPRSGGNSLHNSFEGPESTNGSARLSAKPWEKNNSLSMSLESGSIADSMYSNSEAKRSSSEGVGSLTSQRNSQKFRRKGRCEVISISGAAGLGKSCLVQSIQVEARRRGYFASSKFDQAKKTPFGPVLKLLSSLFKQVFSESNTDTPFHQLLKDYVGPQWKMLHIVLGLPEFLLGSMQNTPKHLSRMSETHAQFNRSVRADFRRRDSSPTSSRASLYSMALGAQSSQDFLRAGTSTKSMRLMNTFLDVLRVFTQHKFICFCLDDLQFADEESLDLITQVVSSRMKIILIVTYRPDEVLPDRIRGIIEPPNAEEYVKAGGVGLTRITLKPLTEDDIIRYVATTLCRPESEIIPLAAVVQSKTAGNPFYIREMLDSCHRKHCVYYDYKESVWNYDLDLIFAQFETNSYHDTLNTEFVTSRLNELPETSRAILAWASLIGHSFSFELVLRLLSGEFDYNDEVNTTDCIPVSSQNAVEGLQAAIQAYIIVPTEDDDRFRFAHDRYMQAATALGPFEAAKMHFVIAQTLLKYYSSEARTKTSTAIHISASIDIIKEKVLHRQSFRQLLYEMAQTAAESGARSTATSQYKACFALLQPDPWDDTKPDVYYDETLQLHTRAAECHLYMGSYSEAKRLLKSVFQHARTAVEKAPAWVLQSRMYAQEGDSPGALNSLKSCLAGLGIDLDDNPTFDKLDAEFERLVLKIQSYDRNDLVRASMAKDSNLAAVGAVLAETIGAAFWTDNITFYSFTLVFINTHLTCGNFPQAGMAYLYLAKIAITRFKMMKFASDMGNISLDLMDRWRDPYTMGRGGTIYSLFVGHIQVSLQESLPQLEGALEYAIQAGDRISTILNFGLVGTLKFFASENLIDLEAFLHYGCEEVPNWNLDARGGTMAIAVRQACRALQGRTSIHSPFEIMDDEQHNSMAYKNWLKASIAYPDRPLTFYKGIEIAPLFLYGYYERAVEIGILALEHVDVIWSARNGRFLMFMQGLSLAGLVWTQLQDPLQTTIKVPRSPGFHDGDDADNQLSPQQQDALRQIKSFKRKIEDWQTVNDVNYLAWSEILAAQIAELENNHGAALKHYEKALDHAAAFDFTLEEALGNFLLGEFFLRSGSRRAAKSALREATGLYRVFGAVGVARHVEESHSLLLQGLSHNDRTVDVGVQTDFAGDSVPAQYQNLDGANEDERQETRNSITETKGDRIGAWQGQSARSAAGSGLPELDMLDLSSILESSQVISSVLQVDQLLKTMCEIILNSGLLATSAAIIVEEDDPIGWSIAASGDTESGAHAHIPGIPLKESELVAECVILYCTRFRETVFVSDLIRDERFGNVTESWAAKNPAGKSIIAIPICHGIKPLLGVLYLEGAPNAFTDRNLTVLQLLVNQIGISYSNALTLKEVEKVSAFNNSMVDVQKAALAKALASEKTAKKAQAEALRSVQLAEEAAKAKSIFLANVSHELRTPLNGVIGNSELLRDSELTKDQAEMADSIRVSADLLLTVINDILDFSKMEADKMELYIVAFRADEMMREVFRSVSYSNRDKKNVKNVEILQDINLPQSLIFGDPVRLHQVLGNLVSNSLKFTENGSITIGARTDWETANEVKLTFWVRDTGIGIPPQQLIKLFKPFSQADASTARKYGGSGLGLSICKSLIESMMRGKIELVSTEGTGTTAFFTVTFPKANEAAVGDCQVLPDSPASKPVEPERTNTPYSDFSHIPRDELRICIAEDNPVNKKIAVQFMHKLGFKTVHAYDNGKEAVEGMRAKSKEGSPYHIVLMDVQMPVLDGYEATKLLRRDPDPAVKGILVIAMTASAIQGDREKCLESGMNDYLAKPVRSVVLKKKLDQYIQQPPTSLPNLQEDAKQVARSVLKEMNGTAPADTSDVTTPSATSPETPTPTDMTRTNSAFKAKTINMHEPQPRRPDSSFRTNSFQNAKTQNTTLKANALEEDQLSPTSLPAKLDAALLAEKAGEGKDKEVDGNPRRSVRSGNEPLFLKSESTGGTEHRSNSVVIDKPMDKQKTEFLEVVDNRARGKRKAREDDS